MFIMENNVRLLSVTIIFYNIILWWNQELLTISTIMVNKLNLGKEEGSYFVETHLTESKCLIFPEIL